MKDTTLTIRLNSIEKQLLKWRADILNMSITDYIKYCCLYSEDIDGVLKDLVSKKEDKLKEKISEFIENV